MVDSADGEIYALDCLVKNDSRNVALVTSSRPRSDPKTVLRVVSACLQRDVDVASLRCLDKDAKKELRAVAKENLRSILDFVRNETWWTSP